MSIVKRLLSSPVITVTLAGSLGLMMWEVHDLRSSHVGITHTAPVWSSDRVAQVETIFTALNMKELDVPVDRAGSGGALTSCINASFFFAGRRASRLPQGFFAVAKRN